MADPAVNQTADGAAEPSLGDLVSLAVSDVSQLIRCELDLAKLELRADVRKLGSAAVLGGFAAVVGTMTLVMLCWAYGYGLIALGIWPWAAFLIVSATLVVLGALAILIGTVLVRRMSGLSKTRNTVQADLALLQRDEGPAVRPAAGAS